MASPHFLVILCGGTGPRLWPLSRADFPKQFLNIFGPQSLLQQTYHRARQIVSPKNIILVTNQHQLATIKKQIPGAQILVEPEKKNTTMAILYATASIKSKCPQATISILPSDHFITKISAFKKDLTLASKLASSTSSIVTIGIKPTSPDLSYGYILHQPTTSKYYKVTKFIEKPNLSTATKLISHQAFWNSGIYTFSIQTMESEIAKYSPEYFKLYQQLLSHTHISKTYQLAPSLAIDKIISEKSKNLIMIKARFTWNDIGEWKSIYQQLPKSTKKFAVIQGQPPLEINSRQCLLHSSPKKIIGLVGVKDLAIIDTPDALLVCNIANDDSYFVRDLITKIVKDPNTKNYFLKSPQ